MDETKEKWKQRWEGAPKGRKIAMGIIAGVFFAVLFAFVFAVVIQALWNWLMPEIFHLTTITYWQAFGIALLARLLFGRIGSSSGSKAEDKKKKAKGTVEDAVKDGVKEAVKEEIKKECGDPKNWKYYDEWWEKEGKDSFDSYAEKKNGDKVDI